jgi:hypothetical protein
MVRDRAKLFSTDALKEAGRQIQEIQDQYDTRLLIETFTSAPANPFRRIQLRTMDGPTRDQFFAELARKRAWRVGSRGIYVLICQEPPPLTVQVEPGSQARGYFSAEDGRQVAEQIRAGLEQGNNDRALLDGVRRVRDLLDTNLGGPVPRPGPFDWMSVVWLVLPFLAAWVVFESVRALHGREPGSRAVGGMNYGGGGSYLSGLFATLANHEIRHLAFHEICTPPDSRWTPVPQGQPDATGDRADTAPYVVAPEAQASHHSGQGGSLPPEEFDGGGPADKGLYPQDSGKSEPVHGEP